MHSRKRYLRDGRGDAARGSRYVVPDSYYEAVDTACGAGQDIARLKRDDPDRRRAGGGKGVLLQISRDVIGPIFFQIIQRKGNEVLAKGIFAHFRVDRARPKSARRPRPAERGRRDCVRPRAAIMLNGLQERSAMPRNPVVDVLPTCPRSVRYAI